MEAQLREAVASGLCKRQPEELLVKEDYMKVEWAVLRRSLLKEERRKHEEQYEQAVTDEEKLAVDRGRLWVEKFRAGGERTAVLKHLSYARQTIYELARKQNIVYHAWEMGGDPKDQKWITVGYDNCEVRDRAAKETALYAPTAKKILKARQDKADAEEKEHLKHVKSIAKSQPEKFTSKHILGTWDVSCHGIENLHGTSDLSMTLFRDPGTEQIVGELEFGVVEGVLRLKGKPSATKPCVEIYWAGRETGESVIICERGDNRKGTIEFSGRGAKAKLFFNGLGCLGSNVTCTAVKVSHQPVEGSVNFSDYSEAAYEDARVSRWG